ncbi:hypothetical protein BOI99_RS07455 [Enterococcus faecium]|uniref:hypothetical protein n=1 Tax=Enterococcus faecium TaxID=1352 RepID=UPI0002AF356B|nr:hypothetical protein [Enterococcus faecium]ERK34954.1 hypothetical protein I131_13395 [Enterococcus faecium CRL1879]AGE29390.1 hypothetical protein M7W_751 [Enterococcus faecium ATCC 8459 = NRRL B-2354]EHU5000154.1 hypothetical protein [Enterococcus faecium]EOH66817.1 hypothetical protein UAG_02690 [Enterococcus faecium ATCC 8459 = NRRL B-2354]EOU08036.1 hypothetical protein I581_00018 [Enterococcus faecium ATCC 8459 = NRRL B-2354]
MRRRLKHLVYMFPITILILIAVTGCKSNSKNEQNQGSPVKPMVQESVSYTFADYMNDKDKETKLWYVTKNDFGKDTAIESVLVFDKDNKISRYKNTKLTIGEVSKMTDEEILEKVKQDEFDYQSARIQGVREDIAMAEELLEKSDSSIVKSGKEFLSKMKSDNNLNPIDIEPSDFYFNIITDSSGNQTEKEEFSFIIHEVSYTDSSYTGLYNVEGDLYAIGDNYVNDETINEAISNKEYQMRTVQNEVTYEITAPTVVRAPQVYESTYNYFPIEPLGWAIAFRTKDLVSLQFDQPDTDIENITIDE